MAWPMTVGSRVAWRIAHIFGDSNDVDEYPDWVPAAGTRVTLTPSIRGWIVYTTPGAGTKVTVLIEPVLAVIDENGWLHTGDMAVMDKEGNISIKGRCKNLLMNASGQNIYPEEIESVLNNMPYVSESIIVMQNEKLVALIYPDYDDAFANGLSNEDIEKAMETNRASLNQQLPGYSQISKVKLHPEEFEKTAKKSIKRFMYQDIQG